MRSKLLILALTLFCGFHASAQAPTVQDCLGAIPVCNQTYSETVSYVGDGNIGNEINTSISCTAGELNSVWYVFTANADGNLGFVITPNNLNDDYDWALFDITNASCNQIATDPSLQVSCNAAGGGTCHGQTGATGASIYSVQGGGCGANPPNQFSGGTPFNALVPMLEGNTYVLMVSNWTGSTFGYTLDFSPSSGVGIYDEIKPEIANVSTPTECNQDRISLVFSEFIKCSTINDTNFELVGPGGPYNISLSSFSCDNGGDHDRFFNLTIDPPIASLGSFTLNLLTNQQDQVLDLCDNPADPYSWNFTVDTPIPIEVSIGSDTSLLCEGNTLVLDPGSGIDATYLWSDGSTNPILPVTTGGFYSVYVEGACGFGTDTTEVIIQYEEPVVELGPDRTLCPDETTILDVYNELSSYIWQNGFTTPTYTVTQTGIYTVSVTNACGTVSDEVSIDYIHPISLNLGSDVVLCKGDSLVLNVASPDATSYLWQDGYNGPKYVVTTTGTYGVRVESICEVKTDTIRVEFIDSPSINLQKDTTLCPGDSIVYDFGIPGATYLWQDGSTAPIYTIDKTGEYAVTVNTACNVLSDHITVIVLDSIRTELGRDTFFCPTDRIILDASSNTLSEYQWMDGNTQVTREVTAPGVYSVRVFNQCEEVRDEITIHECEECFVFVPNAFSPNNDGINDKIRPLSDCELLDYDFRIYNRWGGLVFQSREPNAGWDGYFNGRKVLPGVFIWEFHYAVIENNKKRSGVLTGSVAVVR